MSALIGGLVTILIIGGLVLIFLLFLTGIDRMDNPRPPRRDDQLKRQMARLLAEIQAGDAEIPVLTDEQRDRCGRILRSYYGKEIGPK